MPCHANAMPCRLHVGLTKTWQGRQETGERHSAKHVRAGDMGDWTRHATVDFDVDLRKPEMLNIDAPVS